MTFHTDHAVLPLKVVKSLETRDGALHSLYVINGLPWNFYERIYSLRLGENDLATIAESKGIPYDLVSIRHLTGDGTDEKLEMLRLIHHKDFVTIREVYKHHNDYYAVFEHMHLSLQETVANPYLDDARLAAIVARIVNGLAYLEDKGLQHGRLTCSHVLLNRSGVVKISGQELCSSQLPPGKDIRDLGYVMMELMQGYVKEGYNVGLDDPKRWSADALSFLSATTSAPTATELLKHPFLKRSWRKTNLQGLVSLATVWTRPQYKYLGQIKQCRNGDEDAYAKAKLQ